ncbi:unnamed protein product, partial [Ectocarpus sp. 12 AP-2014]
RHRNFCHQETRKKAPKNNTSCRTAKYIPKEDKCSERNIACEIDHSFLLHARHSLYTRQIVFTEQLQLAHAGIYCYHHNCFKHRGTQPAMLGMQQRQSIAAHSQPC